MANNDKVKNKVCLIVIDGWGISPETKGNAIVNAHTPVMDKLCSGNWQQIEAHGLHVGLPEGLMGNSEVGHLNIGAGRVVYQDIVRINMAVKNKTLTQNEALKNAAERAIKGNGRIHLAGLVSDGGVHSHIDHLFALITALKELKVPKLFIHFLGDGRDTSPTSGVGFLQQLIDFVKKEEYGEISTIVGRYYAMDRDKRWERIRVAYDALIGGIGEKSTIDKAVDVVKARYAKDETDEFLKPIILNDEGRVKDNDTIIFFDYRADRMREITESMGMERYKDLKSELPHPKNLEVIGMTQYKAEFPFPALFPPQTHVNVLAEWLAVQGVTQFHCAETEKYAHVTFFFNGGVERQFENEERCLVPSPKVATYDLLPPMSSAGVADKMVEQINSKKHPFVMCNFAPPDMVGHTGVYEAAVKACEATDTAIGRIFEACKANGYVMMVTADHGNAEKMMAPDGSKHTAHTCNRDIAIGRIFEACKANGYVMMVTADHGNAEKMMAPDGMPFTCSSEEFKFKAKLPDREMALCDVAPTVLHVMGLPIPKEMGGCSLVEG
uniref:2,3-bisphosphoglycerate-independent phosphoglycerate mutase n=1 Tax=Ascaris lumbricoides TaxID=6252 RepID=A0A9J2PGV5_ASCLU